MVRVSSVRTGPIPSFQTNSQKQAKTENKAQAVARPALGNSYGKRVLEGSFSASKRSGEELDQALLEAAKSGDVAEVRYLLNSTSADLEAVDSAGRTPLHYAVKNGHKAVVEVLLQGKITFTIGDQEGNFGAAFRMEPDLHAEDRDGNTPIQLLLRQRKMDPDILKMLLETASSAEKNQFLLFAAEHGSAVGISTLIELGVRVHVRDGKGFTPLHLAAKSVNGKKVKILIEAGAKIDARDNEGRTPLHIAAMEGRVPAFRPLIEGGSDLEARNRAGETPLALAMKNNHTLAAKSLFKKGAQKPVLIAQNVIKQKMISYLKRRGIFNNDLLSYGGNCNGFTFLVNHYWALGREGDFAKYMEAMASWDGKEESLKATVPGTNERLEDVFEQWINDVIWFQQHTIPGRERLQSERTDQLDIIQPHGANLEVKKIASKVSNHSRETLALELKALSRTPNTVAEISVDGHVVSVRVNKDRSVTYYDSNYDYGTKRFTDMEELAKEIFEEQGLKENEQFRIESFKFNYPQKEGNSRSEL